MRVGLGSNYWGDVIQVLEDIIPVYDRVNSWISLGRDTPHRTRTIKRHVSPGSRVLDAGSGFGNMSKTASDLADLSITLYDPLIPMLQNTGRVLAKTPDMSCGIFEHIPFRDDLFDVVMCGYSLRDAINLRVAISEIHRVLRKDGVFVIVDLGKPDNAVIRMGVSFYLRIVLPMIAMAAGGRLGLKFATLYGTYKRWPKNSDLKSMLLEKFSRVDFESGLLGGAVMIGAYK